MKKLSITKEAFEKSKYFTGKYGKLEYVSESGKVFKTNKGKILMFKESKKVNEGLFANIGSDIGYRIDDGIKGLKKVFRGKPKFKVGDELEWKYPKGDEWYPFVVKDVQWIDGQWRYGDENAKTYRPHGFWSRDDWHPQGWCRPKQGTSESTKKFGKKFAKESRAKPTLLTKEEVNVIDKIAEESKMDWFQLNPGKLGGWFVFDADNEEYMSVNDGLDELCQGACNGDWAELFGLTPEEIDVWNNLVKKLNLDPRYMAQATLNESVGDVSKDPAYVCPYCGGNNCEISIGTDDLNFTYLDRLQGETFNVECWCNDCDKPYNVTVELKVKDVYPNEDADDWEEF